MAKVHRVPRLRVQVEVRFVGEQGTVGGVLKLHQLTEEVRLGE